MSAVSTEFNLTQSIAELLNEHNLIKAILDDTKRYCDFVNSKLEEPTNENRKKLFVLSKSSSHHEEIDERLSFLRYIASISDFKISKAELGVIY